MELKKENCNVQVGFLKEFILIIIFRVHSKYKIL